MKNMMKKENGFTLIELIIVIAILAIIAAVAIPNILGAVDNSRRSTDVANAKIIANAAAQVLAKNEEAAGASWAIGGALDVTNLTGTLGTATPNNVFADQLFLELNSAPPVPRFKGTFLNTTATDTLTTTAVTEDEFYLVINSTTGTVEVYVQDTNVILAATNVQVYPTPDPNYTQQ